MTSADQAWPQSTAGEREPAGDPAEERPAEEDLHAPASAGQLPGTASGVVQPDDGQGRGQRLSEPSLETLDRDGAMARWRDIQAGFVDDPVKAVSDADSLVGEYVEQLIRRVTAEREQLQARWHGGGEASTEDLRQGLRRYRSLFERLLAG